MTSANDRSKWEQRYRGAAYLYGTEPNTFLRDAVSELPLGTALCLADGEGRNSVFLASLGHRVSAVDISEVGVEKTRRLAAAHAMSVDAEVGDLASFDLGHERWDLIVSIFAHTPGEVRTRVHGGIAAALRLGGRFVLEAYTPDQVGRGTGGPPVPELTMTLDELRRDLVGLELLHTAELERLVVEGTGHSGIGAVVQVIAERRL